MNQIIAEHKIYWQYGFKQTGETPTQIIGICPFCGKSKFFIRKDSKASDCKVCGFEGGYYKFICQVFDESQKNLQKLNELSTHRNIPVTTLKRFKIGHFNNIFIIPYFVGDTISTIKQYNYDFVKASSDSNACLFNIDKLKNAETIWLCEGEWDTMVMDEVLKDKDEVAIGVSGANTFKTEWAEYFKNKIVHVIYDNDHDKEINGRKVEGAGKKGMQKVFNLLQVISKQIDFIHWEKDCKDGFDIRDLWIKYKQDSKRVYFGLTKRLNPLPPGVSESESKCQIKSFGSGIDYKSVYKAYDKWLHLIDHSILDIMYGTIIANRIPGDPVWMLINGKSGDAKSVLIMSISSCKEIEPVSSMNPAGLISAYGMNAGLDMSLLSIVNNRNIAIKDLTTTLNMHPAALTEVIGILRDAYDGKAVRVTGMGTRAINSRFGVIAGVTPIVEVFFEGQSAFGERFLMHRLQETDDLELEKQLCEKTLANTSFEPLMQKELSEIAIKVLNFDFSKFEVDIPKTYQKKIIALAQWTEILRGTVIRDKFTKEITHKAITSRPTRLSKQYFKLLLGICMFRRISKCTEIEFKIIKKTAHATVPSRIENVIRFMYTKEIVEIKDIAKGIHIPAVMTSRLLENLEMLGAVHGTKIQGDRERKYKLSSVIKNLINESEVYI